LRVPAARTLGNGPFAVLLDGEQSYHIDERMVRLAA
jgi:hypothetical protein